MGATETSTKPKAEKATPKRAPTLYFIIAFKLVKGLLLLLLAVGVYKLHDNNLPEEFNKGLEYLHLDPEKQFFTYLANQLAQVTPAKMVLLARGTGLYSLFSLVEGIGLVFRIPWAGWLAIGESAFFIPIEIYELVKRFPFAHHMKPAISLLVVLGLNVLIVWYLFQNRKRLFRHHH